MGRFAIMRLHKIHTFGQIGGLGKHLERDRETPNADPELTPLNEHIVGSGDWVADVKARLAVAPIVRRNAVIAMQFVITASPEWFAEGESTEEKAQRRDAWRDASISWLRERFGADNLVGAVTHRDETTSHLHALVVPIDEKGRLNARGLVGGPRGRMVELQDSYAASVAPLGLSRGVRGSVAHHQDIQRWYAQMQERDRTPPREPDAYHAAAQIATLEQRVRDLTRQVGDLQQELADRDERLAEGRMRTTLRGSTKVTDPVREGPGNQRLTLILADTPAEALAAAELYRRLHDDREAGPVTSVAMDQTGHIPVREIGRVLSGGGVVRVAVRDDRLAERIRGELPGHRPGQVVRDRPTLGSWGEALRQDELTSRDPKRADRELHERWQQNSPDERSRASLREAVQRWGPQRAQGRDGHER